MTSPDKYDSSSSDEDDEHSIPSYKVVLLGESGTGKTSLVTRFVKGQFYKLQEPTVGATFLSQTITIDECRTVKFEIWDTAGQERFRSLIPMYYRQASAALVVFDITNSSSYKQARSWVKETKRNSENIDIVIALVGNKADLNQNRAVDSGLAQQYADENELIFFETSAKTGKCVNEVFIEMASQLCKKLDQQKKKGDDQGTNEFSEEYDKVFSFVPSARKPDTGCGC